MRLALICLLFSTQIALAQQPCAVCEQAAKLQVELKKFNQADQTQIAKAEQLTRDAHKPDAHDATTMPTPKQQDHA